MSVYGLRRGQTMTEGQSMDEKLEIMHRQKAMREEIGDISSVVDSGWDYWYVRNELGMALATILSETIDMAMAIVDTLGVGDVAK